MEKDFFNTILQNINVVDENGLGYDISLLPEAKKEYENYKNRCLANEWSDSHFDEWSDADTLKFIRKSSLVEFIDDPAKRKQAILENKANVYFPVCDNKSASNEMPWNEIHQLNGVEKYNSLIVAAAKEYSLDPDLLRAIVYMETTHGYYDNASHFTNEYKHSILEVIILGREKGCETVSRKTLDKSAVTIQLQ